MRWIRQKKIAIIGTFTGVIIGYFYWKFVGCASGTCAITSVWWRMTIYGAVMGWLLGDLINDKLNKVKDKKEDK